MAAGTIAALWKFMKISPITGSYIAIPVMLPICFFGIYEYQNHSLWEMWKEMRFYRTTKKLTYGADRQDIYHASSCCKKEKEKKEIIKGQSRKIKFLALFD